MGRLTRAFERERRNTPEAHGASRPPLAELVANVAVFEIARATGVRCHIVHSSLARGFDHARRYREDGVRASAETCVQQPGHSADFGGARRVEEIGGPRPRSLEVLGKPVPLLPGFRGAAMGVVSPPAHCGLAAPQALSRNR